jgi:hypothetical protein
VAEGWTLNNVRNPRKGANMSENHTAGNTLGKEVGNRAEEVAAWYFRLNGFFLLPAFVVHKDNRADYPRTEADLLGLRLRYSAEYIKKQRLKDDERVQRMCKVKGKPYNMALMAEVKAGDCSINGPWSNPDQRNMQYAIERCGFADPNQVETIADSMHENLRWEGKEWVIQYICVGKRIKPDLSNRYPDLVQISFQDIGKFLYERFRLFPEKIPEVAGIEQWPGFGRDYAYWSDAARHNKEFTETNSKTAVQSYIDSGRIG